ncbi:hypothetical protein [Polaribacter cellanae]|uniref:Uncharacterized protein n=1 Tax=Polaribacter cellanae TaxID=2818493 RepID=A0A975CPB3_9FLAO|nr:hypothetical protein [Polaribacter cellanae]QTE22220.1 hypothetical protein J3359_15640 [Polaribacter cellanae]
MEVITFLLHDKGKFTKLKSFFDLSISNTGGIAYIDSETKESIPSEVHKLFIVSKNGNFRDVAYGYSRKHNLKLLEGYPDCKKWIVEVRDYSFKEKIEIKYKQFKNKVFLERFVLSKEFKNCDVFGLEFFVRKKSKKYWKFEKETDNYILGRIDRLKVISN